MLILNHEQSTIYREGFCSSLFKSTSRKANLKELLRVLNDRGESVTVYCCLHSSLFTLGLGFFRQ